MGNYEIRVIRSDGRILLNFREQFDGDISAIAAAKTIAGRRAFEVCLDAHRIYTRVGTDDSPNRAA